MMGLMMMGLILSAMFVGGMVFMLGLILVFGSRQSTNFGVKNLASRLGHGTAVIVEPTYEVTWVDPSDGTTKKQTISRLIDLRANQGVIEALRTKLIKENIAIGSFIGIDASILEEFYKDHTHATFVSCTGDE